MVQPGEYMSADSWMYGVKLKRGAWAEFRFGHVGPLDEAMSMESGSYRNVHCKERQHQKTDPWGTQHTGWQGRGANE